MHFVNHHWKISFLINITIFVFISKRFLSTGTEFQPVYKQERVQNKSGSIMKMLELFNIYAKTNVEEEGKNRANSWHLQYQLNPLFLHNYTLLPKVNLHSLRFTFKSKASLYLRCVRLSDAT